MENSKKIEKIFKKLKNTIWLLLKPKQVGKGREREKIKLINSINSYPTRNREFQKNNKKLKKNKKNIIMASFQAKTGGERPRKSENKNYRSDNFLPDL